MRRHLRVAPTYGVMVYDVIGEPPLPGAVHDTDACAFPAVAVTAVGGAGAVGAVGVTELDCADVLPLPMAFVAAHRECVGRTRASP